VKNLARRTEQRRARVAGKRSRTDVTNCDAKRQRCYRRRGRAGKVGNEQQGQADREEEAKGNKALIWRSDLTDLANRVLDVAVADFVWRECEEAGEKIDGSNSC